MTIESRLARLEQQNRRLKWGLLAALLIAAVGFFGTGPGDSLADQTAQVLRVRELQVVGEDGQMLVFIGGDSRGAGTVSTYSEHGQELIELSARPEGPGSIAAYSGTGQKLVVLSGTAQGQGVVSTFNDKGLKLVELATTEGNAGALYTFTGTGNKLIKLSATPEGDRGVIVAYNRRGLVRSTWP